MHAAEGYQEESAYKLALAGWHPISSTTKIVHLGELKRKSLAALQEKHRLAISSISSERFMASCGFGVSDFNPLIEEQGWFADDTNSFFGMVLRDKVDENWGYMVLARDQAFRFQAIEFPMGFQSRGQARNELQLKIEELLTSPQRVFSTRTAA